MLDPQSRQDLEPILLALLGLPLPELLDLMEWVAARRFPRARREAYEPRERLLLTAISREACRVLFRHRFGQHVRGFARVVEAAASLAVEHNAKGVVSVEHLPFSVAGTDAMLALLSRAISGPPRP